MAERRNFEETKSRLIEIGEELQRMNDVVEAGGFRAFTDDESKKWNALKNEADALSRSLDIERMTVVSAREKGDFRDAYAHVAVMPHVTAERAKSGAMFREALRGNSDVRIELRESAYTTSANVGAAIPVYVQDFIEPLERGLIHNLVGAKIAYGLSGTQKYPIMPRIVASIADETVALQDTSINLESLQPKPRKCGITAFLTGLANLQTDGAVYNWLLKEVVLAVSRTLNTWMFRPTAIAPNVFGALAYDAASNNIQQKSFAGKIPSYKELLGMRGDVMSTGAINDGTYAYVMSAAMYAELEATPKVDGDSSMVITDGKIGGVPVFINEDIEYTSDTQKNATPKHVGFGRWSDLMLGQFGDMRLVIDPYTEASKDVIRVTLNTYWAIDLIRPKSFVIGTVSA
jgi:hypothetical protein